MSDVPALLSALSTSQPGDKIRLKPGTYEIEQGLVVPDGVTLVGEGKMRLSSSGLPMGITDSGRTRVISTSGFSGSMIALGNGAGLNRLQIEDTVGRSGNVVTLLSREPNDTLAAWIKKCELIAPNVSGIAPDGPTGSAILVGSRNLNFELEPEPESNVLLSLKVKQTLVRSPGNSPGLFVINFASHTWVNLALNANVIGGGLELVGGVSRPDETTDSQVRVTSYNNLYRSDGTEPSPYAGWVFIGGSDTPIPTLLSEPTHENKIFIYSKGDRIKGFSAGIDAHGAQRFSATSESIFNNLINISASKLKIESFISDLLLFGDFTFVPSLSAGDGNQTYLNLKKSIGSGVRDNQYVNSNSLLGDANALVIEGSSASFGHSNQRIDPAPPLAFFNSGL